MCSKSSGEPDSDSVFLLVQCLLQGKYSLKVVPASMIDLQSGWSDKCRLCVAAAVSPAMLSPMGILRRMAEHHETGGETLKETQLQYATATLHHHRGCNVFVHRED